MNISIPRETRPYEFRVGLVPNRVKLLTQAGHSCFVEHGAGDGSGFSDADYQDAGAQVVYSAEEAIHRGDLVLKFQRPTETELAWLREGQILMGYLMLPSARESKVKTLLEKRVTAVSYELIEDSKGNLPVMRPMSQIGGRMCAQIAARCLENDAGGKGILLSGVPGVAPAEVVIIGAGTVGVEAARAFVGAGASVYVLDNDLNRLQKIDEMFAGRVVTMAGHAYNIESVCRFADVLVSTVHIPGQRAPIVVTREMVQMMRSRSLIIDVSIDEGGSVETSRPTNHDQPTYTMDGVIHYCVPNIPGVVARTATHAYVNAVWPYMKAVTEQGIEASMEHDPGFAHGVTLHQGKILDSRLASKFKNIAE